MRLEIRIELLNVDSCPHVAKLSSNLLGGWLRHGDVWENGTVCRTGRIPCIKSVPGVLDDLAPISHRTCSAVHKIQTSLGTHSRYSNVPILHLRSPGEPGALLLPLAWLRWIIFTKTSEGISFLGSVGRASVSYAVVSLDSRSHPKIASSSLAGSSLFNSDTHCALDRRTTFSFRRLFFSSAPPPVFHLCNVHCCASPVPADMACHTRED
jgi:hypothetical protein